MTRNQGRVVVVTGASAGVGRAAALAFARAGDRVALIARGVDGLHGALHDIESLGGQALVLPLDVADARQVEEAAQQIEETLGPIDIWVNNAMVTVLAPALEMTAAEYQRVTDVTYLGVVHGTLAALRRMQTRDRGTIVQVGSALAYRAIPLQSAYCAAKFAVRGFTDSLRAELRHDKSRIHLTMVQLSAFNTPQFDWARHKMPHRPQPVPPVFQPEVAAEAIVWAAAHRRREVYVGFPALKAIVGNKFLPAVGDWMAARAAYEGQADKNAPPPDPVRADNLYDPLPGDHGAHGRFDKISKTGSWQLRLSQHRLAVCAVAGLIGLGMAGWLLSLLVS